MYEFLYGVACLVAIVILVVAGMYFSDWVYRKNRDNWKR